MQRLVPHSSLGYHKAQCIFPTMFLLFTYLCLSVAFFLEPQLSHTLPGSPWSSPNPPPRKIQSFQDSFRYHFFEEAFLDSDWVQSPSSRLLGHLLLAHLLLVLLFFCARVWSPASPLTPWDQMLGLTSFGSQCPAGAHKPWGGDGGLSVLGGVEIGEPLCHCAALLWTGWWNKWSQVTHHLFILSTSHNLTLFCLFACLSYYLCNEDPKKGFVDLVHHQTVMPNTVSRRWWVDECSDFVISLSHADGLYHHTV